MTCIKIGCHLFIEQYGEYAYADAFAYDGYSPQSNNEIALKGITIEALHLFNIVQRSFKPLHHKLHFTVHEVGDWFGKLAVEPCVERSILISTRTTNHGYGGKEI